MNLLTFVWFWLRHSLSSFFVANDLFFWCFARFFSNFTLDLSYLCVEIMHTRFHTIADVLIHSIWLDHLWNFISLDKERSRLVTSEFSFSQFRSNNFITMNFLFLFFVFWLFFWALSFRFRFKVDEFIIVSFFFSLFASRPQERCLI